MAFGNYADFAVNEKGERCLAIIKSPLGVEVEIYKTWLYVRDERAWVEGGGYIKPTVMRVEEGRFHYKDVSIIAKRGPQSGVYAVVFWIIRSPEPIYDVFGMAGCGVYAYNEAGEFVGVTAAAGAFLQCLLHDDDREGSEICLPRPFYGMKLPEK